MNDNNKELSENDINQVTGGSKAGQIKIDIELPGVKLDILQDEIEGAPVLKEASSHAIYGEGQKILKYR